MREKVTLQLHTLLVKRLRKTAEDAGVSPGMIVESLLRSALQTRRGGSRAGAELRGELEKGPVGALAVAVNLRKRGSTLIEVAGELNRRGFRTARGRDWSVVAVHRLLSR